MYCPKCDMEFIDGITVCTDCGGVLVESQEAARAMREAEQKELLLKQREYLDKLNQQLEKMQAEADGSDLEAAIPRQAGVYETKAQKYDDLKSSASAFLVVGGLLLAASAVFWTGIIQLPMTGASRLIFQGAMTAMGIFSMAVYLNTTRSAKKLQPEIEKEKQDTEELISWFADRWKASDIDKEIEDSESLSAEEISLKRFQIIQDYLITGKDLPDPAYVDALCEEIYSRLFES